MVRYAVANTPYFCTLFNSHSLVCIRDFQEINYPKKRTTEAQSTQRENFCISFGTFFIWKSLILAGKMPALQSSSKLWLSNLAA